jgi:DNA ligase-1
MVSPAKRRKLNDSKTKSSTPIRSLDYFFGKQKKDAEPSTSSENPPSTEADQELTDEQLARKLQAEWDKDVAGPQSRSSHEGNTATYIPNKESFSPAQIEANNITPEVPIQDEQEVEDLYGLEELAAPKPKNSDDNPKAMPGSRPGSQHTLSLQSAGSLEDTVTASIPFDETPLTFDPSKYIPQLRKHWASESGNASYALLTRCFVLVNSTQSRIKIVDTLVNMLRTIIEGDPNSLLPTVRI